MTIPSLHTIELGRSGRAYIRAVLAEGRALARALLRTVDLSKGNVYTFLPKDVTLKEALNFETGGKFRYTTEEYSFADELGGSWKVTEVGSVRQHIITLVSSFLRETPGNMCLLEHPLARPTDPWVRASPVKVLFADQDVILFASHSDSEERVAMAVSSAENIAPPHIVALVCATPQLVSKLQEKSEISAVDLRNAVKRIRHVLVGAYDAEGYVIWSWSG